MRIRCFQHAAFENAGSIAAWAQTRGHIFEVSQLFASDALPTADTWDWLVLLGGPMSVNDEKEHSWLKAEKEYLASAIRNGKPIIGICLGAQLLAETLGASVYPNEHKEIGWFPIRWFHDDKENSLFQAFPDEAVVFHWHGETFDLPAGAKLLASSIACKNQAFSYGDNVFGFQFHLEMREDNIRSIVEHCRDDLEQSPFVQQVESSMLALSECENTQALLEQFLDRLEARA
ncbi:type 1 glutamine amidotransferase [Paenibacillus sinopodophylli]|uniref:type 1 glutamine amidotransferase n=1 Tax=Paenibacillus sinopodophylli TaxID=1837342 RepID=UPI00110C9DF7|nr:type 1 glutamine amidotransferase [Paenibacillus sinopodophylli]